MDESVSNSVAFSRHLVRVSLTVLSLTVDSRGSSVAVLGFALIIGVLCTLRQVLRVVGPGIDASLSITLDVVVETDVLLSIEVSIYLFLAAARSILSTYNQVTSKGSTNANSDGNGNWGSRAGLNGRESYHKGATCKCFTVHCDGGIVRCVKVCYVARL